MPRLTAKTVLVTGASKGIGRALALGCAREGADVILNYHTDRGGADDAAAEIRALGRRTLVVRADLARPAQIERMFATARKRFPRLDVLINNAGLTGWSELFATTPAKWDLVLDTNLRGTFFCSLAAARWMRDTGTAGAIVNVSTNCAQLGVKNLVAYATSKAGLHGLTKQLAIELAPLGIRVNTFAPGPVNVDRNLRDDPDYRRVWGAMIPLGRTAEPDEMIGPALFLASQDSSYVTGQTFYVDGGWTVQGRIPTENLARAAKKNR
jgi:glucose 1-dehydrogenase